MKSPLFRIFLSLPALLLLSLLATRSEAANVIKADNGLILNNNNSWLSNGLPGYPTNVDVVIWDSTLTVAAYCTNAAGSNTLGSFTNFIWGGIKISNPPATVNITNDATFNRTITMRNTNTVPAIEVNGTQDLIIGNTFNQNSNAVWNVGPGRLLTFADGRTLSIAGDLSFTGNLRWQRTVEINSNKTLTISTGNTIDSVTNDNDLSIRLGASGTGGGHVIQNGGDVLITRSNATGGNILVLGQLTGTTNTYTLSGGTLNTRYQTTVNGTNLIGLAALTTNTMTISGTAQYFPGVAVLAGTSASNSLATMLVSDSAYVESGGAFVIGNGTNSRAVLRLSANAIVRVAPGSNATNLTLANRVGSTGTLSLSNNSQFTVSGAFNVAVGVTSSASIMLVSNTLLSVTGAVAWASGATSAVNVALSEASAVTIGGTVNVGSGAGSTATLTLTDDAIFTAGGTVTLGGEADTAVTLNIRSNAQFRGGATLVTVTNVAAFTNGVCTINVGDNGALSFATGTSFIGLRGTGTLNISNNAAVTFSNLLQISGATAPSTGTGTVNLNGGTLSAGQITRGAIISTAGVTNANLNLNGGLLRAMSNTVNFMPFNAATNPTPVNVLAGGARVDSQAFVVSNSMPFLHGTGVNPDGGLVKIGSGTLLMLGTNTYSGLTVVSNGTLVLTPVHAGKGAVEVRDGAELGVRINTNSPSLILSGLTAGSSTGATLSFDTLTNGNPAAPLVIATNLTVNGTVPVNVAASGAGLSLGVFTLIDFESAIGGTGSLTLGNLPPGVSAELQTNGTQIDLNVTALPLTLVWNGLQDSFWQIGGPTNWTDTGSLNPAVYGNGSTVLFDDSVTGSTAIILNTSVTPGGFDLNFNHSLSNYSISGSGGINGPFPLTKSGTATLTMGVTNNYLGDTFINAGTFKLGTNQPIPAGVQRGNAYVNGTLDLNGFRQSVNGFNGAGVVDNTAATAAAFAFASNGVAGTNVVTLGGATFSNFHNFTGTIQNSGGGALTVVKSGAGNTQLTGTNSYTGGTVIASGTLSVPDGSALGGAANRLTIGATLWLTGGAYTNTQSVTTIANATFSIFTNTTAYFSGNVVPTNAPTGYSYTVASNGTFVMSNSVGLFSNLLFNGATSVLVNVNLTNFTTRLGRGAIPIAPMILDNSTLFMTPGGQLAVGEHTNSQATLHITNGSQIFVEDFYLAKSNNSLSTVFQSSGVLSNQVGGADWRIGGNAAADTNTLGTYLLSGGRVDVLTNLEIGVRGTGVVRITGGTMTSWGGTNYVGRNSGANGTLAISGTGAFTQLDPVRPFIVGDFGTGTLTVTNGGVLTVSSNLVVGNRTNASGVNGSGSVNLDTGGTIRTPRLSVGFNTTNSGNATFNFNGGTLEATGSRTNFMNGFTNAFVQSAGAYINTGTNTVTIASALKDAGVPHTGFLYKLGTGNLTLAGSNTYEGPTTVSAGTLFTTPTAFAGYSSVTVSNGAGFGARVNPTFSQSSLVGSVTFGSGGGTNIFEVDINTSTNPAFNVAVITNLTVNGPVTVNVTGTGSGLTASLTPIVLLKYGSVNIGGSAQFTLGTLPPGVSGALVDNTVNSSIDLVITSIAPLTWDGTVDTNWDFSTINWLVGGVSQVAFFNGADVLLDDSASNSTAINLTTNFSPGSLLISNVTKTYSLAGPGRIAGSIGITKVGAGVVNMGVLNTYSGETLISEGVFRLGTNEVIPNLTNSPSVVVTNTGTLDLFGWTENVVGLVGNGTIENTSGTAATLNIGTNNISSTFTGTILDTGADLLVQKRGTGILTLSGTSTWSGGATVLAGRLDIANNTALGVGPLTINAGATAASSGPRSIANAVLTTTTAGTANLDTTAGDLTLTGPVTADGADVAKIGSGTLTFSPSSVATFGPASEFGIFGGSVVVDGASLTITNDGYRLKATTNFNTVDSTLQNSGSINLLGAANFVVGATADTNLGIVTPIFTNTFTLSSGTLSASNGSFSVANAIANSATFIQNGGTVTFSSLINTGGVVIAGSTNTAGTYRLNAGTLVTSRIRKAGTGANAIATFVFGGGTLRALNLSNAAVFLTGMNTCLVRNAGANIDTDVFNITIGQPMLEDPSSTGGGLTKTGVSNLTLTATNTYIGPTAVTAGNLFLTPTYVSPSTINVANGAGFGARRTAADNGATNGTVNVGTGGASTLHFELGNFGNSTNPVARVTNFTGSGTITVNVAGGGLLPGTIPLLDYDGISGGPTLVTGTLPPGVTATVVDNLTTTTIELVITAVEFVKWDGTVDANWDFSTTNWLFLGNSVTFQNNSDSVLFDDTASNSTDVVLATNVSPAFITISNITKNYSFNGTNQITGSGSLTKHGSGMVTFFTTNNYTGRTVINAGTVKLGTNEIFRHATGTPNLNITNTGVFDLNGFSETVTGIEGNGTVDNTGVTNVLLVIGTNAGTSLFAGVIQDTGGDILVKKAGTGTNTLAGNNTWGGGMLLDNGTLRVGHDNALGTGLLTIDDGTTLATSGGSRTLTNSITSTATAGDANLNTDDGDFTLTGPVNWTVPDFNKTGSNTLTFASNFVTLGTTVELAVRGGALVVDGASVTITNDGFRFYPTTNILSVSATIQGGGSVSLMGAANLTMGSTVDTNVVGPSLGSTITLSSGSLVISNGGLFVGNGIGNSGTFTQSGGTMGFSTATNTNGVALANATNSSGIYNLNGGTLITPRLRSLGTNDALASFRFNGGTLRALNAAFSNDFIQGLDEVLVRAGGATIDTDTFIIAINQALLNDFGSPGGGLLKLGSGTLFLNGANTYTGDTVVTNGTLGGTGTYAGSLVVAAGGTLAPGSSIGTMTFATNASLGGTTVMEINRTNSPNADLLSAGGAMTFGGTLTVTNIGPGLQSGDTFNLFDAASFAGSFSATNLPALTNGMQWDTSQLSTNGTITIITPVTTPATIVDIVYGPGGTNVQLTGTNGQPGATYRIFSEIDMIVPYTNWLPVATNTFDGSGNFNITFPVTPGDIRRFYYIRFP